MTQLTPEERERVPDVISRFWEKVDKNGPVPSHRPDLGQCWLWLAGVRRTGHGMFAANGSHKYAHRFALELTGVTLKPGDPLAHLCENRSCVNPKHLRRGRSRHGLSRVERRAVWKSTRPTTPKTIDGLIKEPRYVARFLDRVTKAGPDECWLWRGFKNQHGYGVTGVTGRTTFIASRMAWAIANGRDPGDMKVLHSCDNPPCCNPAHLRLGTVADNTRDMVERGRGWWQKRRPTLTAALKSAPEPER